MGKLFTIKRYSYSAGKPIDQGQFVYLDTDGKVYPHTGSQPPIGATDNSVKAGDVVKIVVGNSKGRLY